MLHSKYLAGCRANPGQLDSNDCTLRFGGDRHGHSVNSENLHFADTVVVVMGEVGGSGGSPVSGPMQQELL